jgi:hypothetical protein
MPARSTFTPSGGCTQQDAHRACDRGRGRRAAAVFAWLVASAFTANAFAQPPPKAGQAPKETDMEIDPDAPAEKKEEPLPPPEKDAWGVGGTEEEGRFAPQGKTGSLKEQEDDDKQTKEDQKPADLGPPRQLFFETVIGFGEILDPTNASRPTQMSVVSFAPGFRWRFGDTWAATLRVPAATGSVEGPDPDTGDDFKSGALGNIELAVRPSFSLSRRLRLPVGVAITIPSAGGEMFPDGVERGKKGQALIHMAAAASRGWEDNALFTSKRFGIIPNVGIAFDWKGLRLAADTKVEILIKAGGNGPPTAAGTELQAEMHHPAVNWVTTLSAFYDFFDGKLSPGLRFWLSVSKQPISVGTLDYSGAQPVLEPQINSRIKLNQAGSLALGGGVGFILPLGGHLGGAQAASAKGFRINAEFLF